MINSQDGLLVQVAVVLHLTVDNVRGEALHSEVKFVLPELLCCSMHPEVRPARDSGSMELLVVIDGGQTLLENVGVQQWVQSVTGN